MGLLLGLLWFIRTSRIFLFYFYLWQLKEYQVRRFIDHFRTDKGKRLIFNKLDILKLFILACFLLFQWEIAQFVLIFLVFFLYLFEVLKTILNIIQKKIKIPVLTSKTILLISAGLFAEIALLILIAKSQFNFAFLLLFFDLFSPLIACVIVLFFQPLAVLIRNIIIKKAIRKREQFKNLIVVGITGSYGKTSTKEFLAAILSEKFKVLKTKEHQNSEIGIARCILNDLTYKYRVFVVEMGAYRKGGVKLLCDIVKPKIGVVTGINQQHLALFGSMENLISAEGGVELINSLPSDGAVILNGDNEIIKSKIQIKNKIFTSAKERLDYWAEDIKVGKEFISFKVFSKIGEAADFKINIIGGYNVENILMAVAVAHELGMNLNEISKACQNIKQGQGSIVLKKGRGGINILDSSYSANPDGVLADLDYLKIYSGKKIIVMPCLIELGKVSSEIHKKIGRKISDVCDLVVITSKDKFEDLKKGAVGAGMEPKNILLCENAENIFSAVTLFCKSGDVVLLEGRVPQKLIEFLLEK